MSRDGMGMCQQCYAHQLQSCDCDDVDATTAPMREWLALPEEQRKHVMRIMRIDYENWTDSRNTDLAHATRLAIRVLGGKVQP